MGKGDFIMETSRSDTCFHFGRAMQGYLKNLHILSLAQRKIIDKCFSAI